MYNTKLTNLLILIHQQKRFAALHRYLQRQYDNNEGLEFKLWEHLKRYIARKELKSKRLDRKYIEDNLFNKDKKSLNRTASRLYHRVREFMIYEYLSENEIIEDWLFRESLSKENNRLKDLMTDKLIDDVRKPKTETERKLQLFIKFHLNYEKYQEMALGNNNLELFNKVRQLFNDYYMKYYEILEIEKGQRATMRKEDIVPLVELNEKKQQLTIKSSEEILKKMKELDKDPESFDDCKNGFLQLVREDRVTTEMQLTLYSMLFNFAIRQSYKGSKTYLLGNIEDFMYLGFERRILYVNEKIPIYIYTNFLSLIASEHNSEKIKSYAEKYLEEVEEKELKKAYFFTHLFIDFYDKRYDKVSNRIIFNENNVIIGFDFSLRMRIWKFLTCSYFELNEEETLMKALQSFRRYIKGQTVADIKKQMNYNFINYTRMIYKCRDKEGLLKIEDELSNEKVITYKDWLIEKIKESHSKLL